jgi:hypothetical protein
MRIDFIRKAGPSFRKGLDRRRIELGTPKPVHARTDINIARPRGFRLCIRDVPARAALPRHGAECNAFADKQNRRTAPSNSCSQPAFRHSDYTLLAFDGRKV